MRRTLVLLLALTACHTPKHLHEYTYPPSFEYIDRSRLHSGMWQLASEVQHLEQALRNPASDAAAQQQQVTEILLEMEKAAGGLSTPGRLTQHPLLNRNLPHFRDQLSRARADAERNPPSYFSATTLAGSCSACHGRTES